jgi:hypothetical protein
MFEHKSEFTSSRFHGRVDWISALKGRRHGWQRLNECVRLFGRAGLLFLNSPLPGRQFSAAFRQVLQSSPHDPCAQVDPPGSGILCWPSDMFANSNRPYWLKNRIAGPAGHISNIAVFGNVPQYVQTLAANILAQRSQP